MDDVPGFRLSASQNRYLSIEDTEMHAVLTVTVTGGAAAAPVEAAEVIAVDCSGSMDYPPTKIAAARRATAAAIDALRDGALFAVVAGTEVARVVYPPGPRLARATPAERAQAKAAVSRLRADGGTAIGQWLRLAGRLLEERPAAVRHVVLLTDGRNEFESPRQLDAVLRTCEGRFTCDARGIGEDWEPRELLRIAAVLHGTADAVREDADLVADFAAMTRDAMTRRVPDLRLRVKPSGFARLAFLKQTHPTEADLTDLAAPAGGGASLFSTGSWGEETREYHLCLALDGADLRPGMDYMAASVGVEVVLAGSGEVAAPVDPVAVQAHWTEDPKLSSVLDPKVAHYTRQAELGRAVMAGCDAHDAGDHDRAAAEWGRAVALATALGNDRVLVRLRRLVDVVGDPADGVARLKETLLPRDLLSMAMGSVMSTLGPGSGVRDRAQDAAPPGPGVTCPHCGYANPAGMRYCMRCGEELEETP